MCTLMSGENDLAKLLKTLSPVLMEEEYVFCSFKSASYGDHSDLEPFAAIRESEGLTLVIAKSKAEEKDITYQSVFRGITLGVHSSLDAVGLTAAISNKLAVHGISANVIAGYFHDHIFVQREVAERAVLAIEELTQ